MAYTQKDLEAIKKAIAGSQLEVSYGDKRVKFRSIDELERQARIIQAELDAATGRRRSQVFRLRSAGKGI